MKCQHCGWDIRPETKHVPWGGKSMPVPICNVHSTAIDVQAVARAMWGTAPTGKVVALGSSTAGWARYCINMGVSLPVYAAGYALINGSDGVAWLAKGFQAILDEAVKTPILPHSDRRNPR